MEETNLQQVVTAPVSAPESTPAPAPSPVTTPSPTQTSDEGFTSIRDHLSGLGLSDLASRHDDDKSLVDFLIQQHRLAEQSQQLHPYAQRYLQHAPAFEEFLRQQTQLQQQARQYQQQQSRFWNPPVEYNPQWDRYITRDDSGNFVVVPGSGGTPDLLPKYAAYEQYRRDFWHRATHNPEEAFTPLIEQVVGPLVQQQLQQHFGVFHEQNQVHDFLRGEGKWLYQAGPNGAPMRGPDGLFVLTENGNLFANLVKEAEELGLQTAAQQQRYASRVLAAAGRYGAPGGTQQHQQQTLNEQQKNAFLARPNPAGAIGLNSLGVQPSAPEQTLSLADILRRNLAAGGINDEALRQDTR